MPYECGDVDWQRFAYGRIQLLRGLADNRSARQIAARLRDGIRHRALAHRQLKALTGCRDVGELARWWRSHAEDWRRWCAAVAGLDDGTSVPTVWNNSTVGARLVINEPPSESRPDSHIDEFIF